MKKELVQAAEAARQGKEIIQPADDAIAMVEEAGVTYDPTAMHTDLSKPEKRRTTALMLAIQAYKDQLIPTAEYLQTAADLARRNEGPQIRPATIDAVVLAAIKFDHFISGEATAADYQPREVGDGRPEASGA